MRSINKRRDEDCIPTYKTKKPLPGAGREGGEVVFQGTYEGLTVSKTLTGQYINKPALAVTLSQVVTPADRIASPDVCLPAKSFHPNQL